MYCQCVKGNNYSVIGLSEITDDILPVGTPWVEITVPEVLSLPECYPDIETIEKVYIEVVVESIDVVQTPVSALANQEGMVLTGFKAFVNANICQTIVYTADNCEQTVHSINFIYPFCASIILPTTATVDSEYCAKILVEDVYAKPLTPKTICKCVTLFIELEEAQPIVTD